MGVLRSKGPAALSLPAALPAAAPAGSSASRRPLLLVAAASDGAAVARGALRGDPPPLKSWPYDCRGKARGWVISTRTFVAGAGRNTV